MGGLDSAIQGAGTCEPFGTTRALDGFRGPQSLCCSGRSHPPP